MSLYQALFKSDVFRRSNLLIKNDARLFVLLKCYSTDWSSDREAKNKIDQKFVESVRRQTEQRKSSREQFAYVNPTNDQRKIQQQDKKLTKKLKISFDLPTSNERLPIWRSILNWLKTLIELLMGGQRPDAFFFYRDKMSDTSDLLVYVDDHTWPITVGWLFAALIPVLIYRLIQLTRKEAVLSLDGKELDFNLKPWQSAILIGIYILFSLTFLMSQSKSVSTIYYNRQTKLFTVFVYRTSFVRMANIKLVASAGQASEYTTKYPIFSRFYPNTKLKDTMVNIRPENFTKQIYKSVLYGHSKGEYLNRIF